MFCLYLDSIQSLGPWTSRDGGHPGWVISPSQRQTRRTVMDIWEQVRNREPLCVPSALAPPTLTCSQLSAGFSSFGGLFGFITDMMFALRALPETTVTSVCVDLQKEGVNCIKHAAAVQLLYFEVKVLLVFAFFFFDLRLKLLHKTRKLIWDQLQQMFWIFDRIKLVLWSDSVWSNSSPSVSSDESRVQLQTESLSLVSTRNRELYKYEEGKGRWKQNSGSLGRSSQTDLQSC